jgi:hypothetical protein
VSHKKPSHRQIAAQTQRRLSQIVASPESLEINQPARPSVATRTVRVELSAGIDTTPIPPDIQNAISHAQRRIQAFQDRWDQPQIEQFVASDYELVFRVIRWIVQQNLMTGNRMLEWGCGFGVVAALGSALGLDVTGIEAEERLLREARRTMDDFCVPVELVWGNFLPVGAEALSHNPDFPSIGHRVPCAYTQIGSDLDDFSLVFGYPWPGEWTFHEAVFARYGAVGGLLVLFCGPNDVRVWRKVASD